ncbi:MAG: pentapeptide repeat-containing protein [Anaerolineae bacterium]|nr:pentapeptide repeat-containing protein [Anaerolineae bacterium]
MNTVAPDEVVELKKLLTVHKRRLFVLREKQAKKGDDTPADIIMEIEDIEAQIAAIKAKLVAAGALNGLLKVTLEGQHSPEMIEAAKRAFAGVLGIPAEQVKVTYLGEGSVVLLVQVPQKAAERLVAMYEPGTLNLPDLVVETIKSVEWEEIHGELQGKDLRGFDLSYADLSWADLSWADLSGANLTKAYLSHSSLSGATLSGATLSGATLHDADLSQADLNLAILTDADLSLAILTDADLSGADLRRAYLLGLNLTDVIYDETTKWPWQYKPELVEVE